MGTQTTVVILAAGQGTRMQSTRPKVLSPLCGKSLLGWVLAQAEALDPERVVLVIGQGGEAVEAEARALLPDRDLRVVLQEPQLGTGHAVQMAAGELEGSERVVVLYGDMALLRPESLQALVQEQIRAGAGAIAMMTACTPDPTGYGRVLRGADGEFSAIVEERDCTDEQRVVDEINTGVYCFDGPALCADLPRLSSENAQSEYYITDLPGMAMEAGRPVITVDLDLEESLGVNTLSQLAEARWAMQMRILEEHMDAGVAIEDPASTYIDAGVSIGAGTRILPCTVIRSGVVIGTDCEVGPFSHLRVGTRLAPGAEVGNFTECKNASLGAGTKAKHLSYLGDAEVGAGTNIGAGTIFANYDGKAKHLTRVGDGVFVGSGTTIVAPNEIPDGASTGAGAVLTRNSGMRPGEVWVGVPARKMRSGDGTETN
jgi:bifunctional UDP-N-acetylglucosamine pyrophosphorylase/glucosamine-1-phosphate N-acetyltransferase